MRQTRRLYAAIRTQTVCLTISSPRGPVVVPSGRACVQIPCHVQKASLRARGLPSILRTRSDKSWWAKSAIRNRAISPFFQVGAQPATWCLPRCMPTTVVRRVAASHMASIPTFSCRSCRAFWRQTFCRSRFVCEIMLCGNATCRRGHSGESQLSVAASAATQLHRRRGANIVRGQRLSRPVKPSSSCCC